jgi:hypothetical protein
MTKTMYDNHNIKYAAWFESFEDFCAINDIDCAQYNEDSDFFHEWVHDTLSIEWDDMLFNLKHDRENNVDCVVIGFVGRWNGKFEVMPKHFSSLENAIYACVKGCDYITITEDDGVVNVLGYHHDGCNTFEIHKLNEKGYDAKCEDKDLNNEKYFDKFNILW